MISTIELVAIERDPNDALVAQWRWKKKCICGQDCKGTVIGTESEARLDAACAVCNTCWADAMDSDGGEGEWDD